MPSTNSEERSKPLGRELDGATADNYTDPSETEKIEEMKRRQRELESRLREGSKPQQDDRSKP